MASWVTKGNGSPQSITERRVPELIPVLGSQPAGDVSRGPSAPESSTLTTRLPSHPQYPWATAHNYSLVLATKRKYHYVRNLYHHHQHTLKAEDTCSAAAIRNCLTLNDISFP